MTQLHNTIDVIREHFEGLIPEDQRQLFVEEWYKLTIRAEQAGLPVEMFAQMTATTIGFGLGGHIQDLGNTPDVRDKIFESLYLAVAMMFVGAEAASGGVITWARYQSYAKRKAREGERRARKDRRG
jgi:hypothetical protein